MTLAELSEIRMQGKRPEHLLFVTMVPELLRFIPEAVPVSRGDDFIPLADLSVCLCFHTLQLENAITIADQILAESPRDLMLWGVDNGLMTNIVERGYQGITTAVPNDSLRPIVEKMKCRQ